MKRRQRKTVLDINGESNADSQRRRWPSERQAHNGSPSNPLANLVGHYNSDSEAEEERRPRSHVLNDKVNDFFKEIQSISPEDSKNNRNMSYPGSFWQECYDEQTGYPYYWHTETNQVTWEIPPELKALHEKKSQRETMAPSHGSRIPQWSSAPPNKYAQSQSNIPEGMIPKEVVVRNRNRQAGIVNKPVKPPTKTDSFKSPFKKDDIDDYGKIEMITSFGNEESESEESEHEEPPKQKSCLKKPQTKSEKSSSHSTESREPKAQMGPVPPPVTPLNYGPENKERISERLTQNLQKEKLKNSESKEEEDILMRLKSQAKLLQHHGNDDSPNSSRDDRSHTPPKPTTSNSTNKSKKDIKLSLVPGYEDDSEGEEESSNTRKPSKPLFPIPEQTVRNDNHSENVAKKFETTIGNIRVYDYRNADSTSESKAENVSVNSQTNVEEKPEEGLESKANKFLESIDPPSKAFQRKKRIAFDVAPTKSKESESKEEPSSSTPVQVSSTDPSERRGFGFPKDDDRNSPEAEGSSKTETDSTAASKKSGGIAFVKSTEEGSSNSNNSSCDKSPSAANKPREVTETEKVEVRQLTEPIMEKLKFLSEGSSPASAVQVMAIQIQTLLCAWEAGVLQETYLRNWLVGTATELSRLEQTAAPPGWECQWDRSHKRYYYRNSSSGEAQWTYPETDIAGGTEEMDLCTTPPPPEHEEAPIIEMSAQAATLSTGNSSNKDQHEVKPQQPPQPSEPAPPPPPPQISSPSPPPPPRIFAEDLKRGKKRKNSPDRSEQDNESKDAKPRVIEPLPPGVDSPDIAYTLPASALDAGVLYGAQQTNPIYAATLAGAAAAAGIPLLPHHHHTALMQSQLVHYNPAYHQHLHNQALVAARLSGQEAVQFMVAAEYARVYENNQVIAKPPVKVTQESTLGSALNSFYSDIATIEQTAENEREKLEAVPSPIPQIPQMELDPAAADALREKKKKKIKTGIGKKQKEMSSMVAKWQRAQKNYKD